MNVAARTALLTGALVIFGGEPLFAAPSPAPHAGALMTPSPKPAITVPVPSSAPSASVAKPSAGPTAAPSAMPSSPVLPTPSPSASATVPTPAATTLSLNLSLPLLPVVAADGTAIDGTVLIEQRDDSLITGASMAIAAGTDRQHQSQGGVAALQAEVILQTPIQLDGVRLPLMDAVAARGGSVAVNLTGNHVYFILTARRARMAGLLEGLRQALANPALDREHIERARTRLLGQIAAQSQNPIAVGTMIFRSGKYRDSAQAWPFLGSKAEVSVISPVQLREFYQRAYKRGSANVALVGDIDSTVSQAARGALQALAVGQSFPLAVIGWKPFPPNSLVIASAQVPSPVFVLGYDAPSATSPDFGAMYVLMSLFQVGTGFDNITTAMNPVYRPIHVTYDYASSPANLSVLMTSPGESGETAARAILAWIEVLSTRPMDPLSLREAKKLAIGRFLSENFEPDSEARRLSTLAALGMGANGANEIVRRINDVSSAELLHVAATYCAKATYARVSPRSSEAAP